MRLDEGELMNTEAKKTFRHHVVAGARDIMVLITVIGTLGAIGAAATKPFWGPFADIPTEMKKLRVEVAGLQSTLDQRILPRLVQFQGIGQIVGPRKVRAGGTISILYFLRRNASCSTEVSRSFYNVERGTTITTDVFKATKAAVSKQFGPFKMDLMIPEMMPPGRYVYRPTLMPIECGVYQEMGAPPTDVFEVLD